MANVNWASDFFGAVTSRLPDLLTKHGEGKCLEALDELRTELGAADKLAKDKRAKELQAELDGLNGKTPAPEAKPELAEPPAEGPKPAKRS